MLTLLISSTLAIAAGGSFYYLNPTMAFNQSFAIGIFLVLFFALNFLIGRKIYRKSNAIIGSIETDIRNSRTDNAIAKLQSAYYLAKWQPMLKKQLDSQIGTLNYTVRKFDEAKPYLSKSYKAQWVSLCMYAALLYKEKNYDGAMEIMEKGVKKFKKQGFVHSFYAYMLVERGNKDKALQVLNKASEKVKGDKVLTSNLAAVRNNKKMKMQNYGAMWMQMHMSKQVGGMQNYQMHLMNQRFKRG